MRGAVVSWRLRSEIEISMKDKKVIELVETFFKENSFDVDPIPTSSAKTPDLSVKKDGVPFFYCEVKNPHLLIDEKTGLFKHSTTNSKLRQFISKAHEQLKEYDQSHSLPWVVVFVSDHFQLNWNNLGNSIKGFIGNKPPIIVDLRDTNPVKRTNDDIRALDFMIWLQIGRDGKIYQVTVFVNERYKESKMINRVINVLVPGGNTMYKQKFYYR